MTALDGPGYGVQMVTAHKWLRKTVVNGRLGSGLDASFIDAICAIRLM